MLSGGGCFTVLRQGWPRLVSPALSHSYAHNYAVHNQAHCARPGVPCRARAQMRRSGALGGAYLPTFCARVLVRVAWAQIGRYGLVVVLGRSVFKREQLPVAWDSLELVRSAAR